MHNNAQIVVKNAHFAAIKRWTANLPPPSAAGQQKTADPRSERKVNGLLRIKDTYLYGEDTVYSAEYAIYRSASASLFPAL